MLRWFFLKVTEAEKINLMRELTTHIISKSFQFANQGGTLSASGVFIQLLGVKQKSNNFSNGNTEWLYDIARNSQ